MAEKLEEQEQARRLTGENLAIAEQAKVAAMQILQDALDKKMYGYPVSFHYTCGKPIDSYKFCCISTEQYLRDILNKMAMVNFKEDTDPEMNNTYAYVSTDKGDIDRFNNVNLKDAYLREPCTVYLCNLFWHAPDYLCEDSKPGTLIHEVSHFLGTEDISYDHLLVELYEEYGTLLGKRVLVKDKNESYQAQDDVTLINANSLEHEFETVLNHKKEFVNGQYVCCKETKRNSVCASRSTGHYHLHERFEDRRAVAEVRLARMRDSMGSEETRPQKVKFVKNKEKVCRKLIIH